MHAAIPPPRLVTLDTRPSWHNRAGGVDRSACFVITAGQHWRDIHPDDWTYRYPARMPAYRAKGKCDRFATVHFWARDLWTLHKYQPPDPLQGDDRSTKSNALRPRISEAKAKPQRKPRRAQAAQKKNPHDPSNDPPNDAFHYLGPVNPNRGVGFKYYKMLGLDCMWQTTLRIERYVQHHNLKQHFLVCPVCCEHEVRASNSRRPTDAGQENNRHALRKPPVNASGVRRPSAIATTQTRKLPQGRVTKLYLPLCTPQEYEDALIAELWLRTHCHPNRPWPPAAVQLIERYSELFEGQLGRQLRCRQCLNLRYGEVKTHPSTKRQRATQTFYNAMPLAHASCSDKPPPRLTEQSLFLQNLPKLLAKPQAPAAMGAPVACRPGQVPAQTSRPASDRGTQPNPVDTLSAEEKDKLIMLFAAPLPAFQKLAKLRQQTEHEALASALPLIE